MMNDEWWERADKMLNALIVVGVAAMTILLCLGVSAAAAWVIRIIF